MSLVTCPCRKSLASAPVSASLPRSERSTSAQRPVSAAYSAAMVSSAVATPPRIRSSAGFVGALSGGRVAGLRAQLDLDGEALVARQLRVPPRGEPHPAARGELLAAVDP